MRKKLIGLTALLALALPLVLIGPGNELVKAASDLGYGEPRSTENISYDWEFALVDEGVAGPFQKVDLPHSWNTEDTIDGDFTYRMGEGLYKKELDIHVKPGRRYFLRFEGANEKAWVSVNGKEAGSHKGGYTAFAFEITGLVKPGKNLIEVKVDNSLDREIMPLYCDYNFYGGIYRSVWLISTNKDCIAVTDYASPGLYLSQKKVTKEKAEIEFMTRVSADSGDGLKVRFYILDLFFKEIKSIDAPLTRAGDWFEARARITLDNPHLWDGIKDPYMYRARAALISHGDIIDGMEQPLGLRYFNVDVDKGLFLNGKHIKIHGVNRHQDREGKANAISFDDHEEDFALMREMGVNAVRLAHYPQADYAYSTCDQHGLMVWAELPFIGPTGDMTGIFLKSEEFRKILKQQLVELIRQNYNHPSILFWGLFNELAPPGDPYDLLVELNDLAHQEDPYRLTTAATFQQEPYNDISDLICWNRYHGWYYNSPQSFGPWVDKQHAEYPDRKLCISEYGAGASIKQHSEFYYQVPTMGPWHPENWQANVHEKHWAMMMERDYLWGTFIWNMFDFSVVTRREGDRPNINDKGMVTFDRKTKKDAFYFYKANWNDEPMVHITNKRFKKRRLPVIEIKVYSNIDPVILTVNGKEVEMVSEGYGIYRAKHVKLKFGKNEVVADAVAADGRVITDQCEWEL